MMEQFSLWAILLSTVIGMGLGALWYSPVLFGDAWMEALGKTREQLGTGAGAMLGSIAVSFVSAVTMEALIVCTGANNLLAGAGIGVLVGVGLVASAMLSDSLFCSWGSKLYWIQAGYRVTYIVLMGVVSSAWAR